MLEETRAHIEGKAPTYEAEYRMLHKDGSIRWFQFRASAQRMPGARGLSVVGTHMDITERKSAEAKLSEAHSELARLSRLTALGEFAASIAHEINQPLTAMLIDAQTCLRWLSAASPPIEEMRAALIDICAAGNRANELIRRYRELFRNRTVEKLPLDVRSVVRDVVALARMRLDRDDIRLVIALEEDLPAVLGDRVELQQLLLNLLVNGVDAMEAVDPHLRLLRIDASLAADGMVRICVSDSGVGLDNVDLSRIFIPSYTTKPSGTGVGLSISRSIAEAHGGRLWAERHAGRGATFCFTIPSAGAAAVGRLAAGGPPRMRKSRTPSLDAV